MPNTAMIPVDDNESNDTTPAGKKFGEKRIKNMVATAIITKATKYFIFNLDPSITIIAPSIPGRANLNEFRNVSGRVLTINWPATITTPNIIRFIKVDEMIA